MNVRTLLFVAVAATLPACSSPEEAPDVVDGGDAAVDATKAADASPDGARSDGPMGMDGSRANDAGDGSAPGDDASHDDGAVPDDGGAEDADGALDDAMPPGDAADAGDAQATGPVDLTGGTSCSDVLDVTVALTSHEKVHVTAAGVTKAHDPGWNCNAAVPDGSKTYLRFDAPHAGNYVIRVTGGDEAHWHDSAMYARRTCQQLDDNTQLACNTQAGFNSTGPGSTFRSAGRPPGSSRPACGRRWGSTPRTCTGSAATGPFIAWPGRPPSTRPRSFRRVRSWRPARRSP